MKKLTQLLAIIIFVYLTVSAIRPDISQDWRDEWRSLFRSDQPTTVLIPTPIPPTIAPALSATSTPINTSTVDSTQPTSEPAPTPVPPITTTSTPLPTQTPTQILITSSVPPTVTSTVAPSPTATQTQTQTQTPTPLTAVPPPPTTTPPPTNTPIPLPTATPIPTNASTVTPTSPSAPTPTSTSTPIPTTPSGLTQSELATAREYALTLINRARTAAGLNEVTLDNNTAAQSHAEDMRANCFLSHWGSDGLKPYMRYSLAGGQLYSSENAHGSIYCPPDPDLYLTSTTAERLDQAIEGLMNSPGHRRNILNPHHKKVNLGIATEHPNFWFVQLFVGDYVEYTAKPQIQNGMLQMSGSVKNEAQVNRNTLGITITYDRPTYPLTRGQLHNTTCGINGQSIAALRPPLRSNAFYTSDTFIVSGTQCQDPYDVPDDAPAAISSYDHKPNIQFSYKTEGVWITATEWSVTSDSFAVSADISNLLDQHGDGVYTIVLWAEVNGEDVPISEYSIFIPPYSPAP